MQNSHTQYYKIILFFNYEKKFKRFYIVINILYSNNFMKFKEIEVIINIIFNPYKMNDL